MDMLQKPTDEDIRKLHGEVNQITNQRFLLATLAVTVFGIIATWIMKEPPASNGEIGWFRYLASIILLIVLFSLYYLMHKLRAMLRTISSYLIETESSGWEIDWRNFRKEPYSSYTKAHTLLFIILGIIAMFIPFAIPFDSRLTAGPRLIALSVLVIGVMYFIFLIGMGFYDWFDSENSAEKRWKELNNEKLKK